LLKAACQHAAQASMHACTTLIHAQLLEPDQAAPPAQTTRCGDEVENGKPAPDCFRAAAERMGASPGACLVFEDAPAGVAAATAAGMRVVAVPSIRDRSAYPDPDPACTAGLPRQLLQPPCMACSDTACIAGRGRLLHAT
jgi:beta-phosphoglucomutase-like phosphatase (HAD superfamily)